MDDKYSGGLLGWVDPTREWWKSRPDVVKGLLGAVYSMATDPAARESAMARAPKPFTDESAAKVQGTAEGFWNPAGLLGATRKVYGNAASYQGGHKPQGPQGGAPLHDLTGGGKVYPDDVYGPNGLRYYGTGDPGDYQAYYLAQQLKNRPDREVTIYRAVPYEKTPQEQAATLEAQLKKYMARRLLPNGVPLSDEVKWYEEATKKMAELKAMPEADKKVFGINPGDWVALDRAYANQHGRSALGGNFKVVSRKAKAKELFTSGDSFREWGWFPQE